MVRDLLAKNGLLSSEDARRTTIEHRPSGEPYLSMPNEMTTRLHISISHSGLWCACLISDADQPAGIDLEDLSKERDFLHLAEHYFSKDEIEWVKKEGKLPFYKLWTAREAIAKRNGKGLSEALKIELHPISLSTGAVVVENCKCYLTQHITENYIYTIAT
jgi:4'-phosphopantetheinyl transferase